MGVELPRIEVRGRLWRFPPGNRCHQVEITESLEAVLPRLALPAFFGCNVGQMLLELVPGLDRPAVVATKGVGKQQNDPCRVQRTDITTIDACKATFDSGIDGFDDIAP